MGKMGFELYLPPEQQGYIISSYKYPKDKNWNFNTFYSKLNDKDFVIYPGKVSAADCFRIGHIGRIFPSDTTNLVAAMDEVAKEMRTAKYA
jgi:2-aminoethylphosphonate-pyruvate transaminase